MVSPELDETELARSGGKGARPLAAAPVEEPSRNPEVPAKSSGNANSVRSECAVPTSDFGNWSRERVDGHRS